MSAITAELTAGTTVRITTDRHGWDADEPPDAGGADAGPNPYELLLGALAACTCITVSLYCRWKGWKLDNVSVEYFHEHAHARDCEDCEHDEGGALDGVTSRIYIDGDFTDEQRERLAEIAVRCPVHKTLERGIDFADEEVFVA